MELSRFMDALSDELTERDLPVWISRYIFNLIEATCTRMKEAEG